MQERQPLRRHLRSEKIEAGRVAAWPGEASDKSKADWVVSDAEHDRDRRGRGFGRKRRIHPPWENYGHTTAHQVGHQRRQLIVLALQPVVLDRHILAVDVASFAAAAKPVEASADPR